MSNLPSDDVEEVIPDLDSYSYHMILKFNTNGVMEEGRVNMNLYIDASGDVDAKEKLMTSAVLNRAYGLTGSETIDREVNTTLYVADDLLYSELYGVWSRQRLGPNPYRWTNLTHPNQILSLLDASIRANTSEAIVNGEPAIVYHLDVPRKQVIRYIQASSSGLTDSQLTVEGMQDALKDYDMWVWMSKDGRPLKSKVWISMTGRGLSMELDATTYIKYNPVDISIPKEALNATEIIL